MTNDSRLTQNADYALRAQPRSGSVKDQWGDPCKAASVDSYPLSAKCENCGNPISCADGSADWGHVYTKDGRCDPPVGRLTERSGESKSVLGPWTHIDSSGAQS